MNNQLKPANSVNQTDLIDNLVNQYTNLTKKEITTAVKSILAILTNNLAKGNKIELRDFGIFKTRFNAMRVARNPKNGTKVTLNARYTVNFKPGKALSAKINHIPK